MTLLPGCGDTGPRTYRAPYETTPTNRAISRWSPTPIPPTAKAPVPSVRTDGAFTRSVPLPAGADVDDVKATYEKGIIAISVPVPNGQSAVKRIEVKAAD